VIFELHVNNEGKIPSEISENPILSICFEQLKMMISHGFSTNVFDLCGDWFASVMFVDISSICCGLGSATHLNEVQAP